MDDGNSTTTRLLTLLNVSATKIGKRKRVDEDFIPSEKLNKRKSTEPSTTSEKENDSTNEDGIVPGEDVEIEDEAENIDLKDATDPYEQHFDIKPQVLSERSRASVQNQSWKTSRERIGKLGSAIVSVPDTSEASMSVSTASTNSRKSNSTIRSKAKQASSKSAYTASINLPSPLTLNSDQIDLQNDLLSALATNKDLYLTSTLLEQKRWTREAIALHALNHVTKKRRRVLKNNERLSRATKSNPDALPEDVQDQGFTRPSILILLPFRSSALDWFRAITCHTPPPNFQIENQSRFLSEYGLPSGVVDKLVTAEPGTYAPDHVDTFKGNVDDNFRVGVKLTRKTVKLFADFYGCDIIIASPLGLRRSIEKEKNQDYLSSIEMLIIDQMDALTMQNWDHVKFVLSHMNGFPKESRDTDFSRIKPWYLDGHAAYLRQSILLSAYETAETRSLYNSSLKNVAGKIRTEKRWQPIAVPDGIDQNFIHFDCGSPVDEPEKRFHHFTTQLLPAVLKSAVQSVNTIVFVPSSFDFIRVHNYFRGSAGVSFTVLSEYSTNQDISRARQAFFSGQKSFLLISERFHFYKRYKIRGIRNIIFYGPPDHPQYFTELVSYPFLDEGIEASDVTCRVLFSKYDRFRLERIAGTESAMDLIKTI